MKDERFRRPFRWCAAMALLGTAMLLSLGCGHRRESTTAGESSQSAARADSDTAAGHQVQSRVTLTRGA